MTAVELDAAIDDAKFTATAHGDTGNVGEKLHEALTALRTARDMLEQCWWREGYNEKGYCPFCFAEGTKIVHAADCKLVKFLGWK